MFGTIIRFIGSNLLGLGVGYSFGDLINTFSSNDADKTNSEDKKSVIGKALQTITDSIGLPRWFGPALAILFLGFVAVRLGLVGRKK